MENIIKNFCKNYISDNTEIAVALSGGGDSMATLIALTSAVEKEKITAIIVNHKLRNSINEEIALIKSWLTKLNIKFTILSWEHEGIKTNLQEQARDFRYRAMLEFCREHHIKYLFTGHNLDDQIETFLGRLQRGSGIDGLCAMKEISILKDNTNYELSICRPFLSVRKQELTAYLKNMNHPWVEDPSNDNENFLRIKIRKLFQSEEDLYQRIELAVSNLQRSKDFIEQETDKSWHELAYIYSKNLLKLDINLYQKLHQEIRLRILNLAINYFFANGKKKRLDTIIRLDKRIMIGVEGAYSIANLIVNKIKNDLFFQPSIDDERVIINEPGVYEYGSYSFDVSLSQPNLHIAKLSQQYIGLLKKQVTNLPLATKLIVNIPGVFRLENLISIPHIDYYENLEYKNYFKAIF